MEKLSNRSHLLQLRKQLLVRTLLVEGKGKEKKKKKKRKSALRPDFETNKQDADTNAKSPPEALLAILHPNTGRITVPE